MAYFTHIQLKFNLKNLGKIFKAFIIKPNLEDLQKNLSVFFPQKQFVFTDMGRTAFRLLLQNLNLRNSEMLLPAYICDIFFPILQEFNIKPKFLDIELATFNIKVQDIEKEITPKTKAIIVCHTYGLPCSMEKIMALAEKHNLIVIEDIAHSFGAKYQGKYTGNFGRAAFCSLYKQFPTLRGGFTILSEPYQSRLQKTRFGLRDLVSLLNYFSFFSFLFKKFANPIAPQFVRKEKKQELAAINRISLNLFNGFLDDFEKNLAKRQELAHLLQKELAQFGFSVQESQNNVFAFLSALVPENLKEKRDEIVKKLQKRGVFCTRIWHTPLILQPEVQKTYHLDLSQFPNTLSAAKRVLNIPLQNHYTEKVLEKILTSLKFVLQEIGA